MITVVAEKLLLLYCKLHFMHLMHINTHAQA